MTQPGQQPPKVALLFLTGVGPMRNEAVWRAFFALAAYASPQRGLRPGLLPSPADVVDIAQLTSVSPTGGLLPPSTAKPWDDSINYTTPTDIGWFLVDKPSTPFPVRAWEEDVLEAYTQRLLACDKQDEASVQLCGNLGAIADQDLFNVYTHPSSTYMMPEHSLFASSVVSNRVDLSKAYCEHASIKGTLRLIEAAMEDPRNQKFALVSETSIPLYPPQVLWLQMLVEEGSRVNADPASYPNAEREKRWVDSLGTEYLLKSKFAKSQQWVILSRDMALLSLKDKHVEPQFAAWCYTDMRPVPGGNRRCSSSESYFPTLYATYNLVDKTDRSSSSHYVDWAGPTHYGNHPGTFLPYLITTTLPGVMRKAHSPLCDPETTLASAVRLMNGRGVRTTHRAVAETSRTAAALRRDQPHRGVLELGAMPTLSEEEQAAEQVRQVEQLLQPGQLLQPEQQEKVVVEQDAQLSFEQQVVAVEEQAAEKLISSGPSDDEPPVGSDIVSAAVKHWAISAGYVPLSFSCPLFARKFPQKSESQTLRMSLSCWGLGLGPWCKHNTPLEHGLMQ